MFIFTRNIWKRLHTLEEHLGIVFKDDKHYPEYINGEYSELLRFNKRLKDLENKLKEEK